MLSQSDCVVCVLHFDFQKQKATEEEEEEVNDGPKVVMPVADSNFLLDSFNSEVCVFVGKRSFFNWLMQNLGKKSHLSLVALTCGESSQTWGGRTFTFGRM